MMMNETIKETIKSLGAEFHIRVRRGDAEALLLVDVDILPAKLGRTLWWNVAREPFSSAADRAAWAALQLAAGAGLLRAAELSSLELAVFDCELGWLLDRAARELLGFSTCTPAPEPFAQ